MCWSGWKYHVIFSDSQPGVLLTPWGAICKCGWEGILGCYNLGEHGRYLVGAPGMLMSYNWANPKQWKIGLLKCPNCHNVGTADNPDPSVNTGGKQGLHWSAAASVLKPRLLCPSIQQLFSDNTCNTNNEDIWCYTLSLFKKQNLLPLIKFSHSSSHLACLLPPGLDPDYRPARP